MRFDEFDREMRRFEQALDQVMIPTCYTTMKQRNPKKCFCENGDFGTLSQNHFS